LQSGGTCTTAGPNVCSSTSGAHVLRGRVRYLAPEGGFLLRGSAGGGAVNVAQDSVGHGAGGTGAIEGVLVAPRVGAVWCGTSSASATATVLPGADVPACITRGPPLRLAAHSVLIRHATPPQPLSYRALRLARGLRKLRRILYRPDYRLFQQSGWAVGQANAAPIPFCLKHLSLGGLAKTYFLSPLLLINAAYRIIQTECVLSGVVGGGSPHRTYTHSCWSLKGTA